MNDDFFDLQELADQVVDSADPIVPRIDPGDKDRESIRRNVVQDMLDRGLGKGKDSGTKTEKPKRETPPRRKGSLTKRLTEFYTFLGMSLMPFDPVCAAAVINSAEKCAEALDNLAYENDAVRRAIHMLLETSAWGQVAMAHAPILLAIGAHHVPAVQRMMVRMAGAATGNEAEEYLRQKGNGNEPGPNFDNS